MLGVFPVVSIPELSCVAKFTNVIDLNFVVLAKLLTLFYGRDSETVVLDIFLVVTVFVCGGNEIALALGSEFFECSPGQVSRSGRSIGDMIWTNCYRITLSIRLFFRLPIASI